MTFPAASFRGKRVAVFGLGRTGNATVEALRAGGAEVFAWDDAAPSVEKARAAGLPVHDLHSLDFSVLDTLVLSPGVPLTHPEPHWTVLKARAAGIEVIGDTEAFQRELTGSGARLITITGTNGKSTTTALVGHTLKTGGLDVEVGGNIGKAVFLLDKPTPEKIYVLELSSYQIDLMPGLAPDVALLTNLAPDHLDRHGSMEHYASVKARMFAHLPAGAVAAIGVDDVWSATIAAQTPGAVAVSVERALASGISAHDGILRDHRDGCVLDLRTMPALKGRHNWQNAALAWAAARAMGLGAKTIEAAFRSFPGLAHRMQEIATRNGVVFVNDSKATNADAAEKALDAYDRIHWIVGGLPKTGGLASLKPWFPKMIRAYLVGAAAPDFAAELAGHVETLQCGTIAAAVEAAAAAAQPGEVVLLSPACASFDQFANFEVRGDAFVTAVQALPEIIPSNTGTRPC